jgi:ribitol-5-phosphate 2-dehydrogenase
MRGSSRSSIEDFLPVLEAMKNARCQATLRKLLPSERTQIDSVEDFVKAMEFAENNRGWKKVLLDFHW